MTPASVLPAKVSGVGGRHSSHCQLGWQRYFEQLKRLESTNNLHLLQVSGNVSCVQSSCIVRVPCMATLSNLGNVRRIGVDPVRPSGQSKLWPGLSPGKRSGVVAACVVFCGGVAIPVAQEAEAVKPTCEDLRRLRNVSKCQHLTTEVTTYQACFEDL